MLSVMSEPSLGVSGVIPGLDGNFSESSALRDDGRSKNQDSSSTLSGVSKYGLSTTDNTSSSAYPPSEALAIQSEPINKPGSYSISSSYQIHTGSVDPASSSSSSSLHPLTSSTITVAHTASSSLSSSTSPSPAISSTQLPLQQHQQQIPTPTISSNSETVPPPTSSASSSLPPSHNIPQYTILSETPNPGDLTAGQYNGPSSSSTVATATYGSSPGVGGVSKEDAKRLHISNIPFKYRENDLMQLFQGYGHILDVEIIFNDRGSKGFGFITLADSEMALRAKQELNGRLIEGRKIEINEATPRTGPPKGRGYRGSWSSAPPSRSTPYGGNYQFGYNHYPHNRGGYRGRSGQYQGGSGHYQGGSGQYQGGSGQYQGGSGGYNYQQQQGYQEYGGYNYPQNYVAPPPQPQSSNMQQQGWSHHQQQQQPYNYSTGGAGGGGFSGQHSYSNSSRSVQSHDYRYAPY